MLIIIIIIILFYHIYIIFYKKFLQPIKMKPRKSILKQPGEEMFTALKEGDISPRKSGKEFNFYKK